MNSVTKINIYDHYEVKIKTSICEMEILEAVLHKHLRSKRAFDSPLSATMTILNVYKQLGGTRSFRDFQKIWKKNGYTKSKS